MRIDADRARRLAGTLVPTAVLLFFFQALRVLFSVLFDLIYDALFAETASMAAVGLVLILIVLAFLSPLVSPAKPRPRRLVALAGALLVFAARIPLTLNAPRVRLAASLVIVAATGLYLGSRLRGESRNLIRALVLALVLDQLLRGLGDSWDVTLRSAWWMGQAAISLLLCLLAGWQFRQRPAEPQALDHRLDVLSGLGWGAWLFLEMSLLAFPNAVARWSGTPYSTVAPLLLAVTLLPLLAGRYWAPSRSRLAAGLNLGILLAGLVLGYLGSGPVALLALLAAQIASLQLLPALFVPPTNSARERAAPGLALGGVLFLILSFAYAFTFTYAYTLDLFRGIGLPIFVAAALVVGLPLLSRRGTTGPGWQPSRVARLAGTGIALVLVLLVFVASLPSGWPRAAGGSTLKVATYNIHYGYDTDWHLRLREQAQTINTTGAGIVMLQEVDAGRPTSYMVDNALWLAGSVGADPAYPGMESVYLAAMEHLTGIALLSRYPILDSETLLLPSELEQTGIIWAQLDVGGTPVNAFAVWLGLEPEERARQIDAALSFINDHPGPAVFGGDFNSTPGSPVYDRITGTGFVDPFVALEKGSPPTDPAIEPTKRIDFVWLRDLAPVDARVSDSVASDHRLVIVEASLP
jgi:endonuclease/exonuclease/phosphatase family metal-dependent hydrolase